MAQSPYRARVLQLSAELDALRNAPAEPMFSEEEIRARKEKQARDEQLAVLAKLSGDKPLQAVGGALLPEALKASAPRYTEHGEFQPLSGKLSVFPEYTQRVKEGRVATDLGRAEMGEAADLARQDAARLQREAAAPLRAAQEDLARANAARARAAAEAAARKGAEGKPLQGPMLKEMIQLGKDVDAMANVKKTFSEKFAGETSRGFTAIGKAQDVIASAVPGLAPDEWIKNRDAWADLQRLKEIKERHAAFGATLTANEKVSWDAVTPPRGATKEQLKDWFDKQDALISRSIQHTAGAAAAAGGHKGQIEELTRGLWKAPKSEALSEAEQEELKALEAQFGGR